MIMLRLAAPCACALLAVASLAGAAAAQEEITMAGVYRTPDGAVTMTFGADGQMDGMSPTGIHVRDTFVIEDNTFTVTGSDSHPTCPGAIGVYTLTEDDAGVITMTRVSDECQQRGDNLDGGQWVKVEE
jgi:hypothetical protein